MRLAVVADAPIVAGAAGIWSALVLVLALKGVDGLQVGSYANNLLLYLVGLVLMSTAVTAKMLWRERPASPIHFLIVLVRRGDWLRALVRGAPILASLVVFMPPFSAMKTAIPLFHPFNWDATWIAADRLIHGADPWRLWQPLLGYPIITSALSVAYFAWFFLIYSCSIYFCFIARDRELRAQYFIAMFATWTICGVFLATAFASVGPCFVGPLLGDHRFDEQMAYLRAANEQYPVLTLKAQSFLLEAKLHSDRGLGAGISAMPSLHVGIALLFALGLSRLSRIAAIGGFAFFVMILVGSVHLASHYAVDGYVSIVAVLAIWALAGRLARRLASAASPREQAAEEANPQPAPA